MFLFRKRNEEEEDTIKKLPDPSIHTNSNEYKFLSSQADIMSRDNRKGEPVGNGWTVKDNWYDKKSNFKGVLYEKDGQYAFAFAGTERPTLKSLGGWKDWGANLKMGVLGKSRQNDLANEFAKRKIEELGLNKGNTIVLGHSEGAFEATNVGLNNGFKTYTFNGFGVNKNKLPENADYSLVTNYRDPHDPVSKMHANVGNTYITPSTQNKFMRSTPFGLIQAHSIDRMGDCMQAVPVEEYKKKHVFLDKISDAEITAEDIGAMDSKLFALYEPEINQRLRQKQIFPSSYLAGRNVPYVKSSNGSRGYYRRFA